MYPNYQFGFKMKKIVFMLLAAGILTSCSKDNQDIPTPPPPAKQKLDYISKIEEYDKASMKKNYEISFSYDGQKRLTSFEETYPGTNSKKVYNGTLTYADKEVILNYTNNKYQTNMVKPTEIRLALDAKDKVKQLKETIYFKDGTETRIEKDHVYDSEGHQTSYMSPFYDAVTLTWQRGDLIKSVYTKRKTTVINRKYATTANHTYPDLNLFLQGMAASSTWKYLWADLLGLRSTHLLESIDWQNDTPSTATYIYKTDTKGRPTEVEVKRSKAYTNMLVITYVEK